MPHLRLKQVAKIHRDLRLMLQCGHRCHALPDSKTMIFMIALWQFIE
jgi:hypothetical protein